MRPTAQFVFDGVDVLIPPQCGEAASDQMQGTALERLAELAGRECYDSLGRGRSSAAFHEHVAAVGHFSIYEHGNFTVLLPGAVSNCTVLLGLFNRPGLYVRASSATDLRVTLNLRSVLDWDKWPPFLRSSSLTACQLAIQHIAHTLAPQVISDVDCDPSVASLVEAEDDEESWVSLRVTGSRGFSHELVRHGDRTAISQRSTRYVDESVSDWCIHPLVHAAFTSTDLVFAGEFVNAARALYNHTVTTCEPFLTSRGVDKGTARKQARGAARGFLGNALGTSLIFSASVAQWRRMLALRCAAPADAEIRESFVACLMLLCQSRYAECFAEYTLVDSPDGLGQVLGNG